MSSNMQLLVIRTSILGDQSSSNKLIDHWIAEHRPSHVIERNLAADPIPHLDGERFAAINASEPNATQAPIQALSDELIAEIERADAIVIGLPMYNFGVPSQVKAWMDHLARAGRTFRYTDQGPKGLLADKPVTVLATRGGAYADTPHDHQAPFVAQFLGFIGLKNVNFIYAETLASAQRDDVLASARSVIAAA
ncbi:FMN-dependent NADH-azoreductase [Simiduia aestuariiviva]|uniref:FMN dependent NADH:quinone oxidoreductase n=1 Tax=Simiduia aestuariiviva TaxID=1510459 RepID=A0A839URG1_9GAMM|nr:NAD(P)H-dependent oxidoreductase [Simiduia aestuariiviva]MBB3169059.1 FMN-dependent NADH-azoreductase [Simiduia aestuariiviva]